MNPRGCCFLIALAGLVFLACAVLLPDSPNYCVVEAFERSPTLKDYSHLPSPQVVVEGNKISWPKETGVLIWYFLANGDEVGTVKHFEADGKAQEFSLGLYDQDICLVIYNVVYNQVEFVAVSKPLIVMIPGNN